jgi:hypothetical protein
VGSTTSTTGTVTEGSSIASQIGEGFSAVKGLGPARLAGAAVMIYAFYKMGQKLSDFYGGVRTEYWQNRGWMLPRQFAGNFLPKGEFGDYNTAEDGTTISGATAFIDFGKKEVVWSDASGQTSVRESLDEFVERTDRLWMPIDAFAQLAGGGYGKVMSKSEIKKEFGLSFNPSYVMIEGDGTTGEQIVGGVKSGGGVMFAGSVNKSGTFKNSKFVTTTDVSNMSSEG